MIVKAKYYKEIEVMDDISEEEIERICRYGMPDRFDCMADDIDNEKPLEFVCWSYVEDKYYQEHRPKRSKVSKLIMPLILSVLFGLAWGLYKQDFFFGLTNMVTYLVVWIPVSTMVNWVRKVNKFMKGDKDNV